MASEYVVDEDTTQDAVVLENQLGMVNSVGSNLVTLYTTMEAGVDGTDKRVILVTYQNNYNAPVVGQSFVINSGADDGFGSNMTVTPSGNAFILAGDYDSFPNEAEGKTLSLKKYVAPFTQDIDGSSTFSYAEDPQKGMFTCLNSSDKYTVASSGGNSGNNPAPDFRYLVQLWNNEVDWLNDPQGGRRGFKYYREKDLKNPAPGDGAVVNISQDGERVLYLRQRMDAPGMFTVLKTVDVFSIPDGEMPVEVEDVPIMPTIDGNAVKFAGAVGNNGAVITNIDGTDTYIVAITVQTDDSDHVVYYAVQNGIVGTGKVLKNIGQVGMTTLKINNVTTSGGNTDVMLTIMGRNDDGQFISTVALNSV